MRWPLFARGLYSAEDVLELFTRSTGHGLSGFVVFSKSKPAEAATTDSGAPRPDELPDFAAIYDRHFALVWRLASSSRVPQVHLDDVVQETFLVIHRKLPTFEGRSSLRTWIAAITRNTAKEFLQRKRHQLLGNEIDPDASASAAMTPAEHLDAARAATLLDTFLDEMPEEQRDVFVLAEVEQMTGAEIATVLETNPNTVRTRLRAARMSFQASLARHRARERWREA